MYRVLKDVFRFNGIMIPPVAASVTHGPWAAKITKTAGSPTVQTNNGFLELALDNTAEVQNLCLYFGDQLPYSIDKLIQVDIWAKLSAGLAAAVSAAVGVASARNDAIASISARALFRASGNNNLVLDGADGTHTQSAIATGLTWSTTVLRFCLSFKEGIVTVERGLSTGGKSRVGYAAENGQGLLRPLAPTTQFDLSAYSSGLQLFAQIQKTSNAATGTLSVQRAEVQYRS